jgi:hypothetical protein
MNGFKNKFYVITNAYHRLLNLIKVKKKMPYGDN